MLFCIVCLLIRLSPITCAVFKTTAGWFASLFVMLIHAGNLRHVRTVCVHTFNRRPLFACMCQYILNSGSLCAQHEANAVIKGFPEEDFNATGDSKRTKIVVLAWLHGRLLGNVFAIVIRCSLSRNDEVIGRRRIRIKSVVIMKYCLRTRW